MKTRPPEQSDAERAVMAYKHELALRVMGFIVRLAQRQLYVYPGDVPQDIVEKVHRQGVVSNAWGSLEALEIIERLPMNFNDERNEIFGGRKCNRNEGAKARWTGVYRLKSAAAANTWLERNGFRQPQPAPERFVEMELAMA